MKIWSLSLASKGIEVVAIFNNSKSGCFGVKTGFGED